LDEFWHNDRTTKKAFPIAVLALVILGASHPKPATAQTNFLCAADFSFLEYFESLGIQYKDHGQTGDAFQILKNHGINCIRLRLWTSSQAQAMSNPYNYINNTNYTIPLAVRVKNAGLLFSLDFHYSDTWADPGHQATPAAWTNLTFSNLVLQMQSYNSNTIAAFAAAGAMPDYVQIGNEITDGLLWTNGQLTGTWSPTDPGWIRCGQLMKAAVQGVQDASTAAGKPMPKIIVHIDRGGDWSTTSNFFLNLEAQGVPFDIIGQSYYPFFQGNLSALSNCLVNSANLFGKPMIVAETAFPWTNTCPSSWLPDLMGIPPTTIGQVSFLAQEGQILRSVPNGLAMGVFYWSGEYQAANGVNEDGYNTASFWDANGNVLPSVDALASIGAPLTNGSPLALTLAATNLTASNATMTGEGYANGLNSGAYFLWGTTTNYGNVTPSGPLAANYLAQNVALSVSNLQPLTTYHFLEIVTNADGTNFGSDLSFITPAVTVTNQLPYIYQEDFGAVAGNGSSLTLAQVGWNQVLPSTGSPSAGIYSTSALDNNTASPLPSSAAYYYSGASGSGIFYTTNGAGSGADGDSAFTSIDPTQYSNLMLSAETQYSSAGANISSFFAVKVGGLWYVATNPMTAYVESGASIIFSQTSLTYSPVASHWKSLTINNNSVTRGSTPSTNLSGLINGVGIVVILTNTGGSWDYNNLLIQATYPFITAQPTNQSAAPGGSAVFSVSATGAQTMNYQWQFNSANLPGATNPFLTLPNVQATNAGLYQVVLSNTYGSVTSSVAALDVTGVPVSFVTSPGSLLYGNGRFQFSVMGLTGQGPVEIDASTNFTQWVPIYTNPSGFGSFGIVDSNAVLYPQRFYRAVTPGGP
jgi:arabinogalactan endo-1,4-beta-galactosidase